jgi:hypothetical protein
MTTASILADIEGSSSPLFSNDEQVLLLKRRHVITLVQDMVVLVIAALFLSAAAYFGFVYVLHDPFLFLLAFLFFSFVVFSSTVKAIINWYYHIYIVTDHRLLEIKYRPFFCEDVIDILLDQVRCTEVNIQTAGVINQLFNKGDVLITFDRPTHEPGFKFKNIPYPHETAVFLSHVLIPEINHGQKEPGRWVKIQDKDNENVFQFLDDLLPRPKKRYT